MTSKWCCCMQVNSVASANTVNNVLNDDITGLFAFLSLSCYPLIECYNGYAYVFILLIILSLSTRNSSLHLFSVSVFLINSTNL